jgi:hypothetical protein
MAKTRSRTDRFRPLVAPGGTVEGLSLPQHDVKSDEHAVHKQNDRPETAPAANA